MNRDLSTKEYDLILLLINSLEAKTSEILKLQLDTMKVSGGKQTMLELSIDQSAPKVEQLAGPLPIKADVNNDQGEPIGELLLWTTDGYLSQLEYAWYTDQMPQELPELSHIELVTS